MSNQYLLKELEDSELFSGLSELVRRSDVLSARVLAHLLELEARALHLELGFSSLFAYCVEALGMSEGAAGRRVTAARVCRRFPGGFERIAGGDLHLCALCALAPHLNPENATELFDACRGKTRRQIEELLAARFPRPDVREQIRRLPMGSPPVAAAVEPISPSAGRIDAFPSSAIAGEMPTVLGTPVLPPARGRGWDPRRRARELEPLSADRFGVHFTADVELRHLIERARALASHRLPNGDLAGLMKLMAICFVRHEEKRRFGSGTRIRRRKGKTEAKLEVKMATSEAVKSKSEAVKSEAVKSEAVKSEVKTEAKMANANTSEVPMPVKSPVALRASVLRTGKRGRYLPAQVRREVHDRDGGQCAFVSAAGRRCRARAFLEFDHIEPFARLGGADALNIRLLCKAHNLLHARNCFGEMHLTAKSAASRRVRWGKGIEKS